MTAPALQLAFSALIAEQLEDLEEQINGLPKPTPLVAIDYGTLAELVACRLLPELRILAEHGARVEATVGGMQGQLSLIAKQQASLRRRLR